MLTTKGLDESIRNGWPVVALAKIYHPVDAVTTTWSDGYIRLWDGVGSLRYGGNDWRGIGPFGRISGIGGAKRLMLRQVTFEMSGIPGEHAVYLDPTLRNRAVLAWTAGLDARGVHVNGSPYQEVDGFIDHISHETDDGGVQTIKLIVTEPIFNIERAQNKVYSPEWANAYLEDWRAANLGGNRITGYDKIAELANATKSWTAS